MSSRVLSERRRLQQRGALADGDIDECEEPLREEAYPEDQELGGSANSTLEAVPAVGRQEHKRRGRAWRRPCARYTSSSSSSGVPRLSDRNPLIATIAGNKGGEGQRVKYVGDGEEQNGLQMTGMYQMDRTFPVQAFNIWDVAGAYDCYGIIDWYQRARKWNKLQYESTHGAQALKIFLIESVTSCSKRPLLGSRILHRFFKHQTPVYAPMPAKLPGNSQNGRDEIPSACV